MHEATPVKLSGAPSWCNREGAWRLAGRRAAARTGGQGAGTGWGHLAFPFLLLLLLSPGGASLLSRLRRELVWGGAGGFRVRGWVWGGVGGGGLG